MMREVYLNQTVEVDSGKLNLRWICLSFSRFKDSANPSVTSECGEILPFWKESGI